MTQVNDDYDASKISVLKGLESVRKNPGMYVGDTGPKGLHHLVWEIVDNSIDEAMAGFCNEISICIDADGETISVSDNGRGIPVDKHKTEKKSALEVVLTTLHAGGKFEGGGYTASGGLHGVGAACVNALSDKMIAIVRRDGHEWRQEYSRGIPQTKVVATRALKKGEGTGTTIVMHGDIEIFKKGVELSDKMLITRLQEMAFLNPGLTIFYENKQTGLTEQWLYTGGLADYLKHLMVGKECYPTEPICGEDSAQLESRDGQCKVKIALSYAKEEDDEVILGFTNNINQIDGGTHISGFKTALTRAVNQVARTTGILKEKDENLGGQDIREGVNAVVSIRFPRPEFTSQTKSKLGSVEAESVVSNITYSLLTSYFEKNAAVLKEIISRAQLSAAARTAAKKQSDLIKRKGFLGKTNRMPGKLSDCNSNKRELSELFIVEGDSAAGCFSSDTKVALTDGRDLTFQELAVEQLNGKEHFCYTVLDNGSIGIGRIVNVRVTKRAKRWLKVTLDNGEIIENTLNHQYMLHDGSYLPAQLLAENTSLYALYRKFSSKEQPGITIDGYEMLWQSIENRWVFTHVLADNYNLACGIYPESNGNIRHHVDFNKLNNDPVNLVRMWKEDHIQLHRELASLTLHTPEAKAKSAAAKRTPEFRQKMSEKMSKVEYIKSLTDRNQKQWNDPSYIQMMKDAWKKFYDENEEYRNEVLERLQEGQQIYWASDDNKKLASERTSKFFDQHPEKKLELSERAKKQWNNPELLIWRAETTSQQWTPEFKAQRKQTMDQNHYNRIVEEFNCLFKKQPPKLSRSRRSPIKIDDMAAYQRFSRFAEKFFNGNKFQAYDAILCHNHRVKSIEIVESDEEKEFWDLEVEERPSCTRHNFALTAGVFVHNSAKDGRDPEFQAILPIRGKIINSDKQDLNKTLQNKEILNLITAIGTGIRDEYEVDRLRYGKIIVMADADDDGMHIATLLLTFFYRNMRSLITGGHLYLAQPPLFCVDNGKKRDYCFSDDELKETLARNNGKGKVVRFKGLGEMDAEQLAETTMNRESRHLIQLNIEDAAEAERMVSVLMGANVQVRKEHIASQVNSVIAKG